MVHRELPFLLKYLIHIFLLSEGGLRMHISVLCFFAIKSSCIYSVAMLNCFFSIPENMKILVFKSVIWIINVFTKPHKKFKKQFKHQL